MARSEMLAVSGRISKKQTRTQNGTVWIALTLETSGGPLEMIASYDVDLVSVPEGIPVAVNAERKRSLLTGNTIRVREILDYATGAYYYRSR